MTAAEDFSFLVIPPAIWYSPACSICDEPLVDNGDAWGCEPCGLTWDLEDTIAEGVFDEDVDGPRCGAEYEHRFFPAAIYRCLRPQGHSYDDGSPTFHVGLKVTDELNGVDALTWHPDESRKPQTSGGAS